MVVPYPPPPATTSDRREYYLGLRLLAEVDQDSKRGVEACLALGASVDGSHHLYRPPIVEAAERGTASLVLFLIEKGANKSRSRLVLPVQDTASRAYVVSKGTRALHVAAQNYNLDIV